ncbi:hypothetical protein C9F11_45365 (plasmid) [Streptomyces sp. YIM 121038]|uniref:hypothetical protein n=1 Tax=Streptomyces sp. YIM 121038 TaxID=2136401 RepID=UPI0011646A33|nr:hypothetical protein [Streptomyces sp. YIM 121038]QCX82633.1 hypothetical protein C9F11_45365 [Streptomyces sp. YIM 121038]
MTETKGRAAPRGQSAGGDHETIIVLADGTIHAQGILHRSPQTAAVRLGHVRAALTAAAIERQQSLLISTAHPDGRAEHQRITADGTLEPAVPPLPCRRPRARE